MANFAELLKEMNKVASFDRVSTDVVVPKKCKYSREERSHSHKVWVAIK